MELKKNIYNVEGIPIDDQNYLFIILVNNKIEKGIIVLNIMNQFGKLYRKIFGVSDVLTVNQINNKLGNIFDCRAGVFYKMNGWVKLNLNNSLKNQIDGLQEKPLLTIGLNYFKQLYIKLMD